MAKFDLKEYARRGAELRAAELAQELEDIYRAFPDLRRRGRAGATSARKSAAGAPRRRRRRAMSAAEKKAVSIRMKKYWAERRKAKQSK